MVKLSKIVGGALMVLGFCAFASLCFVQLRYGDVMPREPDPTSGRVYPFTAMRFHVYVTREEEARGRWAEILGPFGIVAATVGGYLVRRAARRRPTTEEGSGIARNVPGEPAA